MTDTIISGDSDSAPRAWDGVERAAVVLWMQTIRRVVAERGRGHTLVLHPVNLWQLEREFGPHETWELGAAIAADRDQRVEHFHVMRHGDYARARAAAKNMRKAAKRQRDALLTRRGQERSHDQAVWRTAWKAHIRAEWELREGMIDSWTCARKTTAAQRMMDRSAWTQHEVRKRIVGARP